MNIPVLPTHPTELILAVTTEHATWEASDPDQHTEWEQYRLASTAFLDAVRALGTFPGVGFDPLSRTGVFPGVLLPQKDPVTRYWSVVGVQVTSKTERVLVAASHGGDEESEHVFRAGAN